MYNPYSNCPEFETESFVLRLINIKDTEDLFICYNDKKAVALMNDDNCDFGFYCDDLIKMKNTVEYWIDAYKKQWFIRFSIIDKSKSKCIGTIEGFNGETAVFRLDISSAYEKDKYLHELFEFAMNEFYAIFGNKFLVTKVTPEANERISAVKSCGWYDIYKFKDYYNYYKVSCII